MVYHLTVLAQEGANVVDVAKGLTGDVTELLRAVALVVAIAVVITTYFKTRAWVPTLVSIVMAGIVLWAVNNDAFLRDSTKRTIEEAGQADVRALVAVDAPHDQVQLGRAAHLPWKDDREHREA